MSLLTGKRSHIADEAVMSLAEMASAVVFSSKYDKYYEAVNVNGRTKAKCQQCNKLLNYHGSTSSMKYHLER